MIWLKRPTPGKGPPMPGHVDLQSIMLAGHNLTARGISTPEMDYLRANAPKQSVDKWGDPLPLSLVDQDRLDRTFAILAAPLERGRELLETGRLTPSEVDALKATNPDVLAQLQQDASMQMAAAGAPYAAWAEAVLGFLFLTPAAQWIADQQTSAPKDTPAVKSTGAPPTPVDQLELGVRQQQENRT